MPAHLNPIGIAAQDYVTNGFAIVPIPVGRKGPTLPAWNTREKVITQPEMAPQLGANIGIAHAYCTPSPTASLDIDDLVAARAWLAANNADLDALLTAWDAVQIVSGKAGRAKLLYRLPLGSRPMESITIRSVADSTNGHTILEFRCATREGLTVQDVLPPSIHPETGGAYRWGGKGDWRELPTIPPALLGIWQAELDRRAIIPRRSMLRAAIVGGLDDTPRKRALVNDLLSHISADCSYETYIEIVWAILSLGWLDAEQLARQWCRTAPSRYNETSFNTLVASYDPSRTPTIGTLYHHARQGGWNG